MFIVLSDFHTTRVPTDFLSPLKMTKRIELATLALVFISELFAFNLDLEKAWIYGGKNHIGEYFGYSVALDIYEVNGRRLVQTIFTYVYQF